MIVSQDDSASQLIPRAEKEIHELNWTFQAFVKLPKFRLSFEVAWTISYVYERFVISNNSATNISTRDLCAKIDMYKILDAFRTTDD